MAEEAKSDKKDTQQQLAKASKIEDDTEFEQMSESYNVKGKWHKQIKCIKDDGDCKDPSPDNNKINNNKSHASKVVSGTENETFESTDDKGGDHKPVTVKQGTAVTDLSVYNKKEDDKKEDK